MVTAASLKRDIEQGTEYRARGAGFYQRAEVLNGFDDGSCFGSGPRLGPANVRGTTPFLEFKKVQHIVQEWGQAYEEFRQHAQHQSRRPAKEVSTGSSRLQLVVCPRGRRPRISSDTEWSIYTQFQQEPIEIAAKAPEISTLDAGFFFSGNLTPGAYVLRHEGSDVREFAVHLFRDWTTLIIIDESHDIFFENIKILLIPYKPEENLPTWSSIESVAFEQTIMNLNSSLFAQAYAGTDFSFKKNPILLLFYAHLLARQPDPSHTHIESIASQIKAMIGPCPDVDALLLRAALIRGGELPPVRVTSLPMLREGLLAIVEASHKMPELIPPDSLLEYVCVERLVDSPLSSWSVQPSRLNPRYLDNDDWLTISLEDLATQSHGDMATLDATTIARELGVPTHAVTTRIEVTRERMTRKGGRSISSTADTSSQETKPINDGMRLDASIPSLPGYQFERMIGKGGMGLVYLAKRITTGERIAVKIIHPNAGASKKAIRRFLREIDTLAVLRHDRIIELMDHGYANGGFFFAMPYYERGNVVDWVRRHGRPKLQDAIRIIRDVLEGLAYAHEQGYVHRDIKPQNLLLDDQNRVLVADFGLAKAFENGDQVDAIERSVRGPITTVPPHRKPSWMGTPAFMPNEQVVNFGGVRPSADVWALAAVFYWLLCGATPRDAWGGHIVTSTRIIPIRERRPDLPLGLSNLLDMALSVDPNKRPPDATAFRSLLEEALKGLDIEHLDNSRTASAPAIYDAVDTLYDAVDTLRWRRED
ncbi:MAG TPA: serine/threonine-protein kinase, partial [Polyangium sp.]|nr:serine/threonine-protein kinase [Polyangium sp.]